MEVSINKGKSYYQTQHTKIIQPVDLDQPGELSLEITETGVTVYLDEDGIHHGQTTIKFKDLINQLRKKQHP